MMPPLVLRLNMEKADGRRLRLWLPLFVLWLVALPFVLVSLPVVLLILALLGRKPFAVAAAYWRLFTALPGSSLAARGRGVWFHLELI
ncbi:MAG: hypothetical protein JO261_06695 [Alphaproteobacteria bacterium]|nr:hypothetical protein [Alphaproteobacteria bacterium]MBV9693372.1 hypothetical protein [Alphaproteobacteria bacterium]